MGMDGRKFDDYTKALATGVSRRQVIKGLAGGALGAAVAAVFGSRSDADAACRRIRHPCEGTQECCTGLVCVEAAFEGKSERCCPPGQVACGTGCCAAGQCCQQGNQEVCLASGQCCTAANCPASTDPCKVATCTNGVCGFGNASNGTTCNDNNPCTVSDVCTGGVCGGTAKDCSSASDQCNTGVCNATTGACEAQPLANGTTCNDGNPCTVNDVCTGGTCAGTPVVCPPCHQCNGTTGVCESICAPGEECRNGVCVNVCPNNRPLYCVSTKGKGFKCCPRDSFCDEHADGTVDCGTPSDG